MRPIDMAFLKNRHNIAPLGVIAAVTVLLAAAAGAGVAVGQTGTAEAVQAIVIDVLEAEHNLANLPASASQTGVSASLRGQMKAIARSTIDKLFLGQIHDARIETIVGGIDVEGTDDGIFVWDGGVHDVAFKSTVVVGDSATVIAQATSFLVVSTSRDGERARPENTAILTFALLKVRGQWYVTGEDLEYLPGEGP